MDARDAAVVGARLDTIGATWPTVAGVAPPVTVAALVAMLAPGAVSVASTRYVPSPSWSGHVMGSVMVSPGRTVSSLR